MRAVVATVHGQVQGVGFRWRCLQQAEQTGVAGWVRNLPDGTVEVWIEGEDAAVDALVAWCQEGPRWARVDSVDLRPVAPKGMVDFDVR
ncbi:acylphosphatase [Luteococcus sp. H138]|uniref:acylphosphatase n=1 Tax=unclassified Luteococcus TaxID=2639923 RepID=UPI00313E854D